MDILIIVVGVIVVGVIVLIGVVVVAFLFGFRKAEDDPTKAKIPDHMKTGIAWEDPDMYMGGKQKRRRKKRGKDNFMAGQITKFFKPRR